MANTNQKQSTGVARQQPANAPAREQAPARPAEKPKPVSIVQVFNSPAALRRLTPHIPQGDTLDRIISVVARAARKTPHLDECTDSSLVDAATTILGWNLEIGETAHMVPFFNKTKGRYEATPIMDYKGIAQLLIASGVVRAVEPSIVVEGDELTIEFGTNAYARHLPVWSADRITKKVLGVLLTFRLRGQMSTFRYMTYEEVDKIRQDHSQKWKVGPVPGWYMIKTALRQSRKLLATTPALTRAFAAISQEEEIEAAAQSAEFGSATPSDAELGSPIAPPQITAGALDVKIGEETPAREPGDEPASDADDFQDDRDLDEGR